MFLGFFITCYLKSNIIGNVNTNRQRQIDLYRYKILESEINNTDYNSSKNK